MKTRLDDVEPNCALRPAMAAKSFAWPEPFAPAPAGDLTKTPKTAAFSGWHWHCLQCCYVWMSVYIKQRRP